MTKFERYLDAVIEEALEELDEAEIKFVKGSELTPEQQREVKSKYVHRHTGNNKPDWAKQTWKDGKPYPLHFKDDSDWLENSTFGVTKTGKLHNGTKYCNSSPTYPNNPELRKKLKESFKVGDKIIIDRDGGIEGSIIEVGTGQLKGMYTVRLPRGTTMATPNELKLKESLNEILNTRMVDCADCDYTYNKSLYKYKCPKCGSKKFDGGKLSKDLKNENIELDESEGNGYIAFYKGKKVEVYAETSYKAQQKATEEFQKMFPRNKVKSFDVTVKLAEKDGKQVTTHSESMNEKIYDINKKEKRQTGWKIYSNGKYKTTVFYDNDCDADYVKRAENADKVVKESLDESKKWYIKTKDKKIGTFKSSVEARERAKELGYKAEDIDIIVESNISKVLEALTESLGKCPECGKPLSKGIKAKWDGYKKCDNMNCKKYNVGIPLKEEKDDWKHIYGKCPKCGSKDIKSLSMDQKQCNSCKHKWETNPSIKGI